MIYMKIRCVKSLLKMNIIVLFLILLGFDFPLYNVIKKQFVKLNNTYYKESFVLMDKSIVFAWNSLAL